MIIRHTADSIRCTIEDGIAYLGFDGYNRKPLTPSQSAILAEIIGLCHSSEIGKAIKAARTCPTPGAALAKLS
jgi:hypothetical protein